MQQERPVVIVHDNPVEALMLERMAKQARGKKMVVKQKPVALLDSRSIIPNLRMIHVEERISPVDSSKLITETLTGFFVENGRIELRLRRAPHPLRKFLMAVEPSLSVLALYESGQISRRRKEMLHEAQAFESAHSFGHMIPRKYFERSSQFFYVLPEMYIACGAYGATFTGLMPTKNERVIMKVAWDDADALESFSRRGRLEITTDTGIKSFDRSVLREAIVSRCLSRVAQETMVPWFSLYCTYAYVPLGIDNVLVETRFDSGDFVAWTKSERQSYPSVLKTQDSKVSLFLPQAPAPKRLQASVLLQEMSYETVSSLIQRGQCIKWSLAALKEFVLQIALGIVSYQRTLKLEHGDLHMSNMMVVPWASDHTLVAFDRDQAWPLTTSLGYVVRFIDWGFSRSDSLFGTGDIRTCLSIESEKRLSLTNKLLFPCEFHDMACVLSELLDRVQRIGNPAETRPWLEQVWNSLCDASVAWMGWQTMERGTKDIELTGLYPKRMSEIVGEGMLAWIQKEFSAERMVAAERSVFVHLPQESVVFREAPKGSSIATVLTSMVDKEPFCLPTDAPEVHAGIMGRLVRESWQGAWTPLAQQTAEMEKQAMVEFFSVQVYSYYQKKALTIETIAKSWDALRKEKNMGDIVQQFMTQAEWQNSGALRAFCEHAQLMAPETVVPNKIGKAIEELAAESQEDSSGDLSDDSSDDLLEDSSDDSSDELAYLSE